MKQTLAAILMSFSVVLMCFPSASYARSESGPGNGTDYVKVLFAEAQYALLLNVNQINDAEVETLEVDPAVKAWLQTKSGNATRWHSIKHYIRVMELQYQQAPCTDFTQKPASICFFNDSATGPYVLISLKENKMTTKTQAMAMLIHEAGHFTGETDHLFLDQVGVQLVNAMQAPSLLMADVESTDIVAMPFIAKEECDAGTSKQAQLLKKKLIMDLTVQCQRRQMTCDMQKAQFVFQGKANSRPGVGFDMSVTCQARAVLVLR